MVRWLEPSACNRKPTEITHKGYNTMLIFSQITQMFHFMRKQDIMDASDLTLEMMTDPNNEFRIEDLVIKLDATNDNLTLVTATVLAQLLEQLNGIAALSINRERQQ